MVLDQDCNTSSWTSLPKKSFERALREKYLWPYFQALPTKRQTLLFSATLADSIKELREVALSSDPFCWEQVRILVKNPRVKRVRQSLKPQYFNRASLALDDVIGHGYFCLELAKRIEIWVIWRSFSRWHYLVLPCIKSIDWSNECSWFPVEIHNFFPFLRLSKSNQALLQTELSLFWLFA